MTKEFNVTGVCFPDKHYMVNTSEKLNAIMNLVERGKYFTINRSLFGRIENLAWRSRPSKRLGSIVRLYGQLGPDRRLSRHFQPQ
jgi:hypothetical protein